MTYYHGMKINLSIFFFEFYRVVIEAGGGLISFQDDPVLIRTDTFEVDGKVQGPLNTGW
jgi:hypothetical protein